ncbi:MAG TPA: LptF/LptG family permease [Longimicrobiaceae bacterium]|nr:LptF/LptG family permease [Longimicrobiaceae bacterium]
MIRILDRYVAYQFLRTFVLLVMGLPLLFVITDVTDNLDKYVDRGLAMSTVALSYVYQLPLFILYAFPIAALVATVFTIGGMTGHMEISAAKAAGVSFYRIVAPIAVLAVLLSGLAMALGEVVPVAIRKRAVLLGEHRDRETTLRTNFVFQTERSGVLSVRRLDPGSSQMHGVVLERKATPRAAGVHGVAQMGRWTPKEGWKFEQGYLRVLTQSGEERTFSFTSLRLPELRETPEDLLAEPLEPEEMRYNEMTRFIRAIERSGGDARPLLVERAQKISLPLAVFVIVLFGAPLSTSSKRGGAAYGVGISLVITLVYLLLFRVCRALGESGALEPMVAAWLPNALFFLAGVFLLVRVRT